jgi:hypothetical protein
VPGRFHVATEFWHLFFFPLLPLGTHVVLSEEGDRFRGVPIAASAKSMLLAWGRAFLCVIALWSLLAGWAEYRAWGRAEKDLKALDVSRLSERQAKSEVEYLENQKQTRHGRLVFLACLFGGVVVLLGVLAILPYRAGFERAVQLGLAAQVPPESLAAQYHQPVPGAEQQARLLSEIKPPDPEQRWSARTQYFALIFLALGCLLSYLAFSAWLAEGFRSWESAIIRAGIAVGCLLLTWLALGILANWGKKTTVRGALLLLVLFAILAAAGPYPSQWSQGR